MTIGRDIEPLAVGQLPGGETARVFTNDMVTPEMRAAVLDTIKAAFGPGWPGFTLPVTADEHLAWKLEGPFAEAPTYLCLVESAGRLVALSNAVRERALVHGHEVEVEGGGDACTHPEFQGRGLYGRRRDFEADALEPRFAGALSTAGDPRVLHDRVKRDESVAPENDPRVLVRVLRAGAYARARRADGSRWPWPLAAVPFLAARMLGAARSLRLRRSSPAWDLEQIGQFDERFDQLFEDAATPFEFIKVRTSAYLNWRYADIRAGEFTRISASDASGVLGYVVIKLQRSRSYVMDLLARPGRIDVADTLLQRALESAADAGSSAVVCWLPNQHPYRKLLARHGFLDARQPTGLAVASFRSRDGHRLDFLRERPARWHVMLGDTDNA